MEDSGLVAIGGAGKGFKAVERNRWDSPVACVRKGDVAGYLGTDGLREVVVEDQPVEVAGKVFDGAGGVGSRREILAAFGHHIDAALVDAHIADGAGQGGVGLSDR